MGVFCDVHVCVRRAEPLSADERGRVVELCIDEQLLTGKCTFGVPKPVRPESLREWAHRVLRGPIGPSFGECALQPYNGLHHDRAVHILEERAAGAWMLARAREATTSFAFGCSAPKWKGKTVDGGFVYLALAGAPVHVRTFDAYAAKLDPNRDVGDFWDVLSISSKHDLDAETAARATIVKRLRSELGLELTCRESWW